MKIKKFLSVLLAAAAVFCAFALTASAELVDTTQDVTLTIYALETENESDITVDESVTGEELSMDEQPIPNVTFALVKVAPDETSTEWPEGKEPDYISDPTDEDGAVTVVIPAENQGRYLVQQLTVPVNAQSTTVPFLVDLPMTNPWGDGYLYNVYAYPKEIFSGAILPVDTDLDVNTDTDDEDSRTLPLPEITKKVSDDGITWGEGANIASIENKRAYWKVSVLVPESIGRLTVFTVGDVLDDRLTPPEQNEVKASIEGSELPASAYAVSITGQTITVDFKASELVFSKNKTVDIILPTYIDLTKERAIGERIPNKATLTFTRLRGTPDTDGSDTDIDVPGPDGNPVPTPVTTISSPTVDVWTAEIKGFKHDDGNNGLAGAEFELYSDSSCTGKISAAVSDSNGKFAFKGLKDGTYFLKEIKAPNGFVLNENVLEVRVNITDNRAAEIEVLNVRQTNLPVTGGAGIIGITAVGLCIAALGSLMIALSLKARKKALTASA